MKPKFLPNSGLARTGKQTGRGALTTGSGDFVPPAQTDGEQWRIADADYRRLRDVVYELSAIDLMHYRTQQMERRLTSYLERSGKETWGAYSLSLYQHPAELHNFLEFLTINVSSFYRDADKWDQLSQMILPQLLQQSSPYGLQAWSIGCSMGAEPYSLAMLLNEAAAERRHKIFAGDIDLSVLERARAGGPYSHTELREIPQEWIDKYLIPLGKHQFRVAPAIRHGVTFERFDLLQETTGRLYDLVICRNLVIYFTPASKERVFHGLAQALKVGGVLFIGSTETIANYRRFGFEYIAPSFYRRTA